MLSNIFSGMFKLNARDFIKGVVMSVLGGVFLPIMAAFQTPGFDLLNADWKGLGMLALNGAFLGFTTYLVKNFFTNKDDKVLGAI